MTKREELEEKFCFRDILPEEAEEAGRVEQICFPPNEACTPLRIRERIEVASDFFLVAMDKKSGKMAGFFNGIATDEESFRDAFFEEASLHDPKGANVMLLGLDVCPEYRMQGLASELVRRYCERERRKGRKGLVLTCLENKIPMYEKMGFQNRGLANSTWGGEQWYEMYYPLFEEGV